MFSQRHDVTLRLHQSPTQKAPGKYEVIIAGQASGIYVPAQALEAAIEVNSATLLLFLTDDVPYEEALTIVLVSLATGVKETLWLGGPYVTGWFTGLRIVGDAVTFSFIGDTTWRVEVAEKPFFRLPFCGDPRGIWRPLAWKHSLLVSADPPPAHMDGTR